MSKKHYTLLALFVFLLYSCDKTNDDPSDQDHGTLKGIIGMYVGNCMPVNHCEPVPISTTVAITTPAEYFDINLLVDSVIANSDGSYEISLLAGEYSLFLRDTTGFVCENWSCPNDCYCNYFTIQNDSITTVNANLDHAIW